MEPDSEIVSKYDFGRFHIRANMMAALYRWITYGKKPGDFLTAVIQNNLSEACGRADEENLKNLPAFVAYLYNEAPSPCWGSKEKMEAWIKKHEEELDGKLRCQLE